MKNFLNILIPAVLVYLLILTFAYAAPVSNLFRNILPESDLQFDFGSTTPAARWQNVFTQNASTTNLTAFGRLLVGGTATTTILGNSATSTFSGGIQINGTGNVCLANGNCMGVGGGGSGITSLNSLTGASQTFADNDYVD